MKRLISAILVLVIILSIPMQASAWWWDTDAKKYEKAIAKLNEGNWAEAIELFEKIPMYEDSAKYKTYAKAMQLAAEGYYDLAIASMTALGDFKDSALLVVYLQGLKAESLEEYDEAEALYMTIPSFRDVMDRLAAIPGKKDAKLTLKRTALIADIRTSENAWDDNELWYRIESLLEETYTTSETLLLEELYADADAFLAEGMYTQARFIFGALGCPANYSDSWNMISYTAGRQYESEEDYENAFWAYASSESVRDSDERCAAIIDKVKAILVENRTAFIAALRASESITPEIEEHMAALLEDTYIYTENVHYEGLYAEAETLLEEGLYKKALYLFQTLEQKGYSDSAQMVTYTRGRWNESLCEYQYAYNAYAEVPQLRDVPTRIANVSDILLRAERETLIEALFNGSAESDQEFEAKILALMEKTYSTSNTLLFEELYADAEALLTAGKKDYAFGLFYLLMEKNYGDSYLRVSEFKHDEALEHMAKGNYDDAYSILLNQVDEEYEGRADSIDECLYQFALLAESEARFAYAYSQFVILGDYKDSAEKAATYENRYANAEALRGEGKYEEAVEAFAALGDYSDAATQILATYYAKGEALLTNGDWEAAKAAFSNAGTYQDATTMITETDYRKACSLSANGQYDDAISLYTTLGDYGDSKNLAVQANADKLYAAGDIAAAYDVYTTLGEAYQTHSADYASAYADATAMMEAGQYDDAIAAFGKLGNYSDAAAMIPEVQYRKAGSLVATQDYAAAAAIYTSIWNFKDSREQHYLAGTAAYEAGNLADAIAILSADIDYSNAKETVYQAGVAASKAKQYELSIIAFTNVGNYKDAAMKLTMDTYVFGDQLFNAADYDRSAEVFASMGDFSDTPTRANEARYAAAEAAMTNGNYDDAAKRFAAIGTYNDSAEKASTAAYAAASEQLEAGNYSDAKARFAALGEYSDSTQMVLECDYLPAKALYEAKQYGEALNAFTSANLSDYSDSDTIMTDCRYQLGKAAMSSGDYTTARDWFDTVQDYQDSKAQTTECRRLIALASAQELEANGEYEAAYAQYDLCNEPAKMEEMAYQTALTKLSASDYEAAISWYEKAGSYSDAKEQILSIGEYYYATQQYDLAEAVYVKVLDTGIAAQRLYELGQYYELAGNNERAAKAYREAGSYEDATDKAMNCEYQMAEVLYAAKEWEGAKALYAKMTGYKDVDRKIAACDNALAAAAALDAAFQPGKYVSFGHYPQTTAGNDNTPIEWLVIARDGRKALLLSRYGLDAKPYNTLYTSITWEQCTLRKWLNNDFLNKAFSSQEQRAIVLTDVDNSKNQGSNKWSTNGGNNTQDKVFLLSYAEANKHLGVTYDDSKNTKSRVEPTAYAIKQGAFTSSSTKTADGKAAGWWWLRVPGSNQNGAACVYDDGSLSGGSVSNGTGSVRPALWVDIDLVAPFATYGK